MLTNTEYLVDLSLRLPNVDVDRNVDPLTLSDAICAIRYLITAITGFTVTTEIVAANLEAPELALPLIGWLGMIAFVSLFVIIEKSRCSVKLIGEDQSPSQSLLQVLKPFGCVFLPFIAIGLTATPATFSILRLDDDKPQSWLPVFQDGLGLIAALCGLYKITPKEDWIQQRNHLLGTIAGFMILGLINALGEINDAYSSPLAYDPPIPEQAVLPLSSMLAVIFAVTMTMFQSGSLGCNSLTSLCNIFNKPSNPAEGETGTLADPLLPTT